MRPLLFRCLEGYNASILAYGQTGSGKTFTMGTGSQTFGNLEEGIVPRIIEDLFAEIEKRKNEKSIMLKIQYFEIYNDMLNDLLD